jgi:hypothetical protein
MRTRESIVPFTLVSALAALVSTLALAVQASSQAPGNAPDPRGARPPAPTLSRATPGVKGTHPDGFIQRWLLLEPIQVPGQLTQPAVRAAVEKDVPTPLDPLPRDGDTVTVRDSRLAWHALDTSKYNVNLYHFAYALGRPTSNVLFWAITVVHSPRELRGVRLAIGSNAASVWWVNDTEATALYNDRQAVIDDGVSKRLTLKQGANVIRAAIINAGGATDFCARFLDEHDRPIKTLTVALEGR